MARTISLAAADLGAESGRVLLGAFDGSTLQTEVVHRFANRPVVVREVLHWNILTIYDEILQGLLRAKEVSENPLASVGIDTWGVDFGILDARGNLLGTPVHYRDRRTEGMIDEVTAIIPRADIYAETGIAFWPFNTLYQLRALVKHNSPVVRDCHTLLFTPDLLHYWLSGTRVCERSIASTSQCLQVSDDLWATSLLESLDIPPSLFPDIVESGTDLGVAATEVQERIGIPGMRVIAPTSHDTAAAVVATPLHSPQAAYLSCGTWSLLGIESPTPILTPEALQANITNEKGIGRSYRVMRNIMGLWLVQQAHAVWARGGQHYSYAELADLACEAEPFYTWINPNDQRFLAPADMVAAVHEYCREHNQHPPNTVPQVTRCLLESLAFAYRDTVDRLEALFGITIPCLHIIGGGSQNRTLCQWTANALQRPVIAGPVEGTGMGNILTQLIALGEIADLPQARQVIRASVQLQTYEPAHTESWQEAYERYQAHLGKDEG